MITEKGLTAAEHTVLLKKLGGMEVARGIIIGAVAFKVIKVSFLIRCTFRVMVDETQIIENLVKMGKFNTSDDNIVSAKFPKPARCNKSEKEISNFHFGRDISSKNGIAEMNKACHKPATIFDLLSLAVKQPNIQRESTIVALGSICIINGRRHVPCLYGNSNHRGLSLDFFDEVWPSDYEFAAVLK
jgi:hypothetical protein